VVEIGRPQRAGIDCVYGRKNFALADLELDREGDAQKKKKQRTKKTGPSAGNGVNFEGDLRKLYI